MKHEGGRRQLPSSQRLGYTCTDKQNENFVIAFKLKVQSSLSQPNLCDQTYKSNTRIYLLHLESKTVYRACGHSAIHIHRNSIALLHSYITLVATIRNTWIDLDLSWKVCDQLTPMSHTQELWKRKE